MTIARIVTTWSGLTGLPGYSVMYTRAPFSSQGLFVSFFQGWLVDIPNTLTLTVPSTGALIDEVTGKQTDVWSNGTQTATLGQGTNSYAPQSGAQVRWETGKFNRGRRVRGRTFLVPLGTGAYGNSGVLSPNTVTRIKTAADQLITFLGSTNLVVWTRPVYKEDPAGGDPILERPGAIFNVTSSVVPTKPVTLNRRRDT